MATTSHTTDEDVQFGSGNEEEFFCTDTIVPRKIKPQNIVIRLMDREIYGCRKPGSHFHVVREFYQNVFPNLTIVNVEKPPCFLRKFSPDGKHFIAFSADQTSLEIYEYRGAAAAADLIAGYPLDLLNADADAHHRIRTHIFYRFFKPKFIVNVCQQREIPRPDRNPAQMPFADQQLNRECSLFTEDGRYVIVGSAVHIPDDLRPHFYHIHSNNEAVTPTVRSNLEDYSLHLIDLHQGKLCDTKDFRIDKIYLSHNQGIYLYKEVLAVLSVQHQTIHLFQIVEGMLIEMRKIGRFCFDDDPFIVNSVFAPPMNERPYHEETINSLKHRLLVFLYKRAKAITEETRNPLELRKFYKYFDMFKSLRMWKMQLLDEDHLFIKYASEDVVTLRVPEPNSQSSFFVIYQISESKILEVYENTSENLLELFENYCDCFRNARLCADSQFTCSPSNNLYARLTQQRFKQTIVRAIYGGRTEATKRILAQLPISAQSYSGSPYLDLGLFSYDDKWVSVMERPKAYGEYPIRFYARDSGLLKFKIYAGVLGQSVPASARRLVAFTFHPTDPFAISVQRTNSEYIVNFHIRNADQYPNSQYAQSPQPFVLGEGDVASVVNPNGTYSFFFVPTMKPWLTITFNPNMPSYVHPYWYTDSGVWIVRSISNPIPWNLFLQMIQKYSSNVEYNNPINISCPNTQLPLPESSQQNMDTQPIQFHNDCVTSTTDLHYFFPRPNISVNTLRMRCQCNVAKEEFNSQYCAADKTNEMEVAPQSANHKWNEVQEGASYAPQFSMPQQVVCNRPCYCVHPPNSNNQNPMNAFSFRQPYQNGATEYATQVKEKDKATCTCRPDRPYLPCLCLSGQNVRKSTRKSRSKYTSSDSLSEDDKSLKAKKSKKCGKDSVVSVKKRKPRSLSQYSSCKCADQDKYEKRKQSKNNLKSVYRKKHDQRKNEFLTYSSSSVCDNENCPVHTKNDKKTCNKNTCPVKIRSSKESVCTIDTCSILNRKEDDSKSCNNETCSARKKNSKSSICTNKTCPARLKRSQESIPLRIVSSCDNESCPAQEIDQSSSSCDNKTCSALKNDKKSSSSEAAMCNVKKEKSSESITSWNAEIELDKKAKSKGSSSTCNVDTCPAKKKVPSCEEICPAKKAESKRSCPKVCNKEEPISTREELRPKEEPISCNEICSKEELILKEREAPSCDGICHADQKKCSKDTCRARKKAMVDSDDSQNKEKEYKIQYFDTLVSSSSKSDCDSKNCLPRKKEKKTKSKSSVVYVHKKDVQDSCDCSACSVSNHSVKKAPFSWRSYIIPAKLTSTSKSKKSKGSTCCSKTANAYKSCSVLSNDKQPIKQNKNMQQKLSDDFIRTAGKKYKPRICCNMGTRFLIGKRRKEDTNCCTCSSNSFKEDFCTGCTLKETSTDARKSTVDRHITTYTDNSTNCAKTDATQTKRCKCYPKCHKKDYFYKKDYEAEIWTPKINCDFNCHQFLLDLRGSVPCLYSKTLQ